MWNSDEYIVSENDVVSSVIKRRRFDFLIIKKKRCNETTSFVINKTTSFRFNGSVKTVG
jgi:hypothetical protein